MGEQVSMRLLEAVLADSGAWATDVPPAETQLAAQRVVHCLEGSQATARLKTSEGVLTWCYCEQEGTLVTHYPNGTARLRVLELNSSGDVLLDAELRHLT